MTRIDRKGPAPLSGLWFVGGLVICAWFAIMAGQPVQAAMVAVYDGPLYVDPNSSSALQDILQAGGHTVTTFTGTPPASTDAPPDSLFVDVAMDAFVATDVIVFPFSNSLLSSRLTGSTVSLLRSSVESGGRGLLTIGNGGVTLLNRIFFPSPPPTYSSTGTGGPSTLTNEAVGTLFETGLALLSEPADGAMNPFEFTPPGHVNLYRDSGGNGGATAFAAPMGHGQLGFLGWNFTPEQDDDWNMVLNTMATHLAIPEPATCWLLAMTSSLVIGYRRHDRKAP